MQRFRDRFRNPDGSKEGTVQTCIRTIDLDLVGDGSHLTSFEMVGNFSFGNNDYLETLLLWHRILQRLEVPVTHVTVHPTQDHVRTFWEQKGYRVVDDPECQWSDGEIGGYCSEVFCGNLEIGNLVNTLGHSVDVGFGLERLVQVLEGKGRVDETSLFRQDLSPVARDHVRTLEVVFRNGIVPGFKGRGHIVRKLYKKVFLEIEGQSFVFDEWLEPEKQAQRKNLLDARRSFRRNWRKPDEWWLSTFGLTPEDIGRVRPE